MIRLCWGLPGRFRAATPASPTKRLGPSMSRAQSYGAPAKRLWRLCRRILKEAHSGGTVGASIGPMAQPELSPGATFPRTSEDSGSGSDSRQDSQGSGAGAGTCGGPAPDPDPHEPVCGMDGAEQCRAEEDAFSHASAAPRQGLLKQRRDHVPEQRVELILPSHAEPWVVARVLESGDPHALLVRLAAEVTAVSQPAGDGPMDPSGQPDTDSERTEPRD